MNKLLIAGMLSAMMATCAFGAAEYTDSDLDILSHVICGGADMRGEQE